MDADRQREWQLEGSAAELYERHLVPAVTAVWAADLVQRLDVVRGQRVLDVACGTGVLARAAAARVGSTGFVAAVDVNPEMLAVARSLPPVRGAVIAWREGSAPALPFGADEFDVVTCQLGLQFFPDRPAALGEMRRVLAGGGRIGVSVFTAIERNPATNSLSHALDRHVGPSASLAKRMEHSLADAAELCELVAAAGFKDVRIETVTKTIRFSSAAEYVHVQLAATPLASVVAGLGSARREDIVRSLVRDVAIELAPYSDDTGLSFPQEVHVLQAAG